MTLVFSTKAGTLSDLAGMLNTASVLPLYSFTIQKWQESKTDCLKQIKKVLPDGPWIVRSSAINEDTHTSSNAGVYLSIPDVSEHELKNAIEQVILAYPEKNSAHEVLIQPMLKNVILSGVAFSHDPNTRAPYRLINWSRSTDTSAVTGGRHANLWQGAACSPVEPPSELKSTLALLEEIISLSPNTPVDCEFAVTLTEHKEQLWLLQARPLCMKDIVQSNEEQSKQLSLIYEKIKRGIQPHPFLMGRKTVYGVMPDWNPAEIIGTRPRPLALSIYRDLVTDATWAYQRNNYGYRNLRSFPLMPHFLGLPYIDVRVSFNSFIPSRLDESIANRLVEYYIQRLISEPALHDKIEFEIVFSCYSLDLPDRLKVLLDAGFSNQDLNAISENLRLLTNRILDPKDGLWRIDAAKLETLSKRRDHLYASSADPLARIYWLLEDGRRYGTLPFAGLARAGFIAVQMLRSLVTAGIFSEEEYHAFISGVSTVGKQLGRDKAMLDKTSFLSRYGHLRPGTYDILSPRYDERPDMYFDWENKKEIPETCTPFSFTLNQMKAISSCLEEHQLHPDPVALIEFIQAGIEMRELAKFHFTRNLSDSLSLIGAYGESLGFSKEDISFADISVFKELHIAALEPKELIAHSIEQGRILHQQTCTLSLPPLITDPSEVWAFTWPETVPNFITQKEITAKVTTPSDRERISGTVVCIPNADPGFDWLFSYPIAGLITAWGGANSHMAIRAGELGIPAVIGAGEKAFEKWSEAKTLHIDCRGRRIEIIS
jgi:glutamine kinase